MNKKLRILLLEDNPSDAELVERELCRAQLSFSLKLVENKEAFSRALKDFGPHLILSDYSLPSFDGLSALVIAQKKCPHVPFIFVSGVIGEEMAIETLKKGAVDYVLKDRLSRLVPVVKRALNEVEEKIKLKQAEEKLLYEQELLHTLMDNIPDSIYFKDSKNRFVIVNKAKAKHSDATPREMIGKSDFDFFPKEVARSSFKDDKQVMESGKPLIDKVEKIAYLDGTARWLSVTKIPWYNDRGKIVGTIGISRDITGRKKAEEALREEKKRAEQYLDIVEVMLVIVNAEENITLINKKGCKILGYKEEELIGKNWFDTVVPQRIRDEVRGVFRKLMAGDIKPVEYYENPLLTKDGKERLIAFHNTVIRGRNDQIVGILFSAEDITERKKAEEKLRESEENLRHLFKNPSIGIVTMDAYGTILSANPRIIKILGMPREDIVGKHFREFLGSLSLDIEEVQKRFQIILSGDPGNWHNEWEMTDNKGNHLVLDIQTTSMKSNKNIVGFSFFVMDISERRKAEDKIKAALKEKELLLKEIHHRVKNNLQVISSLLNLQSRYIKDKEMLGVFKESQNRIKSLSFVHEKLYQSKDLARIDLKDYIKDLVNSLFQSYGTNTGKIALGIDVENIPLGIDYAIPCGLIVNELVSNSLKHAFPKDRKGKIYISFHSDDDKFTLIISDNGIGLPKDLDFRNTETLGLQLVCTLTDQLEGSIKLNKDGGTEFKITFTKVKRG